MGHWHECRICKQYFECHCEVLCRLSSCCRDCTQKLRETLFMDSALKQLLGLPTNNN